MDKRLLITLLLSIICALTVLIVTIVVAAGGWTPITLLSGKNGNTNGNSLECKIIEECEFFMWYIDNGNYGKRGFTKQVVDATLRKHDCGFDVRNAGNIRKVNCPIKTKPDAVPNLGTRTVVASKERSECNNPEVVSALQIKHVNSEDLLDNGVISLPSKESPDKEEYKNLKKGFPILGKHIVTKVEAFGSCFCWKLYSDTSFKGEVKLISEGDEIELEFNLGSIKRVTCSELEDYYYDDG